MSARSQMAEGLEQVAGLPDPVGGIRPGSFVFLGDRSTKFGDPAAGATELFLKARFTY